MSETVANKLRELCLSYVGTDPELHEQARDYYLLALEDYGQGDSFQTVKDRLTDDLVKLVQSKSKVS